MQVVYLEYFNFCLNINILALCFHLRRSFPHDSLRDKKAVALGLLSGTLCSSHHREQLFGAYSLLNHLIFAKQSWLFCNGVLFFFFLYLLMYLCLAVLGLCCCVAFSLVASSSGVHSLVAVCGRLTNIGFYYCRGQALGTRGSVVRPQL